MGVSSKMHNIEIARKIGTMGLSSSLKYAGFVLINIINTCLVLSPKCKVIFKLLCNNRRKTFQKTLEARTFILEINMCQIDHFILNRCLTIKKFVPLE